MLGTFSKVLPGSFTEMSPDYGCVVQAWTIYAFAVPMIRHFFGVKPDAYRKRVLIKPSLPKVWRDRSCSLSGLRIGEAELDIRIAPGEQEGEQRITIANKQGWHIMLDWNGKRLESSDHHMEWLVS